jgi:hypothetical protein
MPLRLDAGTCHQLPSPSREEDACASPSSQDFSEPHLGPCRQAPLVDPSKYSSRRGKYRLLQPGTLVEKSVNNPFNQMERTQVPINVPGPPLGVEPRARRILAEPTDGWSADPFCQFRAEESSPPYNRRWGEEPKGLEVLSLPCVIGLL